MGVEAEILVQDVWVNGPAWWIGGSVDQASGGRVDSPEDTEDNRCKAEADAGT